jgi:hypothetical protein
MLVRMKAGGFVAPDEKFREAAPGAPQRQAQIRFGVLVSSTAWQIPDERRYPEMTMTDIFEV